MSDSKTGSNIKVKHKALRLLRKLGKDQQGLSTVEYVIILALVAIAAITAWTQFGDMLITKIGEEKGTISNLDTSAR